MTPQEAKKFMTIADHVIGYDDLGRMYVLKSRYQRVTHKVGKIVQVECLVSLSNPEVYRAVIRKTLKEID